MGGRILASRMAMIVLALAGLFDAALLARDRARQLAAEICVFETACEQLLMSERSTLPPVTGVPVAIIGLAGFGAIVALAGLGLLRERLGPLPIGVALLAATSLALAFAAYLLAAQLRAIGTICPRCFPSEFLALGLWIAALVGLRTRPAGAAALAPPPPLEAAGQAG